MNLEAIGKAWASLQRVADVGPIRDDDHYARMVELSDALVKSGQANEGAALEGLFLVVCELIADHDRQHFVLPPVPPREMLRFLMNQHGLTQSDLPEVGNQSVLSQLLSGKRQLTTRQVARLASRFDVPADVLIDRTAAAA
ncbi:MAG: helix-turn-helix domain-containing protein [Xanthomonadales bacterium]|nr:helix-turn-helix domain-containing protein [Xanthomonadales bacterium]MCC6561806.1 helix-turn-helix domain-containing protein [Xanthomonadales bacterium]